MRSRRRSRRPRRSTTNSTTPARGVLGGGLEPPETATVVRAGDGGTVLTDGPFAESKEQIGGFWVIEARDLDAALEWAEKGARACANPVEARPFQPVPE